MDYHPDDLLYDTSQMLDRIRPKQRYDIAIVAIATVLGIAIVWAAALLKPHPPMRYAFISEGTKLFVGDKTSGEVAACQLQGDEVRCSESDSAHQAWIRQLEIDEP